MATFVKYVRETQMNMPACEQLYKEKEEKENQRKEKFNKEKPFIKFPGKYLYTTDYIECASICDDLLKEAEKVEDLLVLGFDLEWPFNFQTGPGSTALMQICANTNDKIVYLFQLSEIKKLPATLTTLLAHPKVRIVGVNIRNDVHKLCRDFPRINKEPLLKNCIDSRIQARDLTDLTGWSMDKLVNHFFDKSVDKNKKVRMSKWNVLPLSKTQKYYAATDAYVSLLLYQHLIKLDKEQEQGDKKEVNPLEELL